MWGRRQGPQGAQRPPQTVPDTLAGAAQVGADGWSGMVPAHRAFTRVDSGGRLDQLGRDVVAPSGSLDAGRVPESWYTDRVLYGGVRTAAAFGEYRDEPGNTGGYQVITGRQAFTFTDPVFLTEEAGPAVFRDPPRPEACRRIPTGTTGGGFYPRLTSDALAPRLT